jgi:hypothetical protein
MGKTKDGVLVVYMEVDGGFPWLLVEERVEIIVSAKRKAALLGGLCCG